MALTEQQRKRKQEEQDATDFGHNRAAFRDRLTSTETSTRRVQTQAVSKGREAKFKTVTTKRKVLDRARFNKAQTNFASRGASTAEAQAQSRGAGGGSFTSEGDFGPGAIRLNTVTPVNSKLRGR